MSADFLVMHCEIMTAFAFTSTSRFRLKGLALGIACHAGAIASYDIVFLSSSRLVFLSCLLSDWRKVSPACAF